MSEQMSPLPFKELFRWASAEYENHGKMFGIYKPYKASGNALPIFGEKIETPFGPAAGPHTQLAQNIIAAYFAGARFFELKTVQIMDGHALAACIARPCILANDEGYNCEWSTELYVPQAFDEYVKAWVALKMLSKLYGLGDPDGFVFNMSVGYDLKGIKSEKINAFIDGLKDASGTRIFIESLRTLKQEYPEHSDYIKAISPVICRSATVSTLHGCPPQEIEAITSHLIKEKNLNAYVKCNPTILGYDTARKILDGLGYDYISFDDHHFREDLQYEDAVPIIRRLLELACSKGLEFGLKLSNTFPVDVKAKELPSEEMYMSGRALFPLTIEMARRLSKEFDGKLRISYSGGADFFNIEKLVSAGIWPVTMATTLLKPGGYQRLKQLAEKLEKTEKKAFKGIDLEKLNAIADEAQRGGYHEKSIKPLPSRKLDKKVPLIDCFTAPCKGGCPISQDIPEYVELTNEKRYLEALKVITEKNALPFITGTICAHHCMDKCTRNFYESPVYIRGCKLLAAQNAYDELMNELSVPDKQVAGIKAAIIGGGPAGISAGYFLGREGVEATIFEKAGALGGVVRQVIPDFRISNEAVDKDVRLMQRYGVEVKLNTPAPSVKALKEAGYTHILFAIGAWKGGRLDIGGNVLGVIDFLKRLKDGEKIDLGASVAVVGGGNTAMDAARAAKRAEGVKKVTVVYRRTKKYMPADQEELELVISEGIEFLELVSPVKQENGRLVCKVMKLGEPDASGRRSPVETDELTSIDCDTVISAVGERVDYDQFTQNGIALDEKNRAPFETNIPGVFVAGDALRGPATVVEAIADARRFALKVLPKKRAFAIPEGAVLSYAAATAKKGILKQPESKDTDRCLACGSVCENCVGVCPNRANVALKVAGKDMMQIVHIDRFCNECGNCATFCPYDSSPYKEKFTLFSEKSEFESSKNDGYIPAGENRVLVRLNGEVKEYDLGSQNDLDKEIESLIFAIKSGYSYMLV